MKYVLSLLLIGCLGACQYFNKVSLQHQSDPNLVPIFVPDTLQATSYDSMYDLKQYIILDTSVLIGSISKIKCVGDLLYVGDFKNTKDVYCYHIDGRLLWQCHLNMPVTRIELNDFDVDPDSYQLSVIKESKIYRFDRNGRALDTLAMEGSSGKLATLGADDFFLYSFFDNTDKKSAIALYNKDGDLLSNHISMASRCTQDIYCISNLNSTAQSGLYVYSNFANDTIYHLEKQGFSARYYIQYGLKNSFPNLFSINSDYESLNEMANSNNLSLGTDIVYETENYLHFVYLRDHKYTSIYYHKPTHQVSKIDQTSDNLFGGTLGFIPYGIMPNDKVLLIVEPFALDKIKQNQKNLNHSMHPFFKEILAKTTSFSNPVIVVAQIKKS